MRRSSAPVYNILAHWRSGSRAPCSPYQRASLRQFAPVKIGQLAHPPSTAIFLIRAARSPITAVHLIKAIAGSAGFLSIGVASGGRLPRGRFDLPTTDEDDLLEFPLFRIPPLTLENFAGLDPSLDHLFGRLSPDLGNILDYFPGAMLSLRFQRISPGTAEVGESLVQNLQYFSVA